jgi:hypothetical protein
MFIQPTTVEPTTAAPTTVETTTAEANPLADIGAPYTFAELRFEGGLFCRDVFAAGGSYGEAVRYW